MCRTNNKSQSLRPAARCVLLVVGLCLLLSAAPCVDLDADEPCDLCDQDDLIAGPAAPCAEASTLLLEQPECCQLAAPVSLPSRISRPPIF